MDTADSSTNAHSSGSTSWTRLRAAVAHLFNISTIGCELPWAIVMVGGCIVTAILFNRTYLRESERLTDEFTNRSDERAQAIQQGIRDKVAALELMGEFFTASDEIRPAEFRVLVKGLMDHHPDMLSLEWIPLVEPSQLDDFKALHKANPDSGIALQSLARRLAVAPDTTALPILFAEPEQPTSPEPLSDLREDPMRWPTLLKAWETRRSSATILRASAGTVCHTGECDAKTLLFFVAPVFEPPQPGAAPDQPQPIIGFTGMSVNGHRLVASKLAGLKPGWVDLSVEARTSPASSPTLIHAQGSRNHSTEPDNPRPAGSPVTELSREYQFPIAGCRWYVECHPSPRLLARYGHSDSLMLLIAGGLITALASIYVRAISQIERRTRREVRERTAELNEANALLRHEIGERATAVRALQAAETRYRGIFEHAPDGIFRAELDGRLCVVNPAFATICGYDNPRQLLDSVESMPRALLADSREWETICGQLHASGELNDRELRIRHRDGNLVWVSAKIRTSMSVEDGTTLLEGVMMDISLRKRAEEENRRLEAQLRQSQKMEALGTLAGGIAHDFNNILTAIIGYAELLSLGLGKDPLFRHKVQGILNGAVRAKDLVRQILAFSCAQKLERTPVRLGHLMDEAISLLRASLPTTIEIEFANETVEDQVMADPTQIHQIIMNLGTNAAQAMEDHHGTIRVHLLDVELEPDRAAHVGLAPGDYLCIRLSDNGHGIPPEVVDRIFEPFFTTKPVGKGTGLGLSVVHGIIQGHGGAISVSSQLGLGTTFDIYLPRANTLPVEGPEPADTPPPGGNESILLVDDETQVVDVMEEVLTLLGYRVTAYYHSPAAWDDFRHRPTEFDIVVTDQTMPGLTGLQLATRIRKLNPTVPLILCTGYTPGISKEALRQAGRCHLAAKPLEPTRLSQIIRSVLHRSSSGGQDQWETAMLGAVE